MADQRQPDPSTHFDFISVPQIVFGAGRYCELPEIVARFGSKVCLVTGSSSLERSGKLGTLMDGFKQAGLSTERVVVTGEPTVELIDELVSQARSADCDVICAVGGGSVLDAGKAIAALLANGGECLDYLEGVGRGRSIDKPALPFIAVPTTAGTGSEVTKNAVLGNKDKTFKKSMRSPSMMARVALVDPDFLADCPLEVMAACGMDALVQNFESLLSAHSNAMTDSIAADGLAHAQHLPILMDHPEDPGFRQHMALAGLRGGIALANAGLGAIHGLASPIGAHHDIPHGVICARLLAPALRANTRRAVEVVHVELLADIHNIALMLGADPREDRIPEDGDDDRAWAEYYADQGSRLADYFDELVDDVEIKPLGKYGLKSKHFDQIIAGARGNSMKTNPVELTDDDLRKILKAAT